MAWSGLLSTHRSVTSVKNASIFAWASAAGCVPAGAGGAWSPQAQSNNAADTAITSARMITPLSAQRARDSASTPTAELIGRMDEIDWRIALGIRTKRHPYDRMNRH